MKETVVGYVDEDSYASFTSAEKKWINKILKLKAEHPEQVDIKAYPENNQGYIYAHLPKKWLKVSPPRQVSEEQKAAAAERLKAMRNNKNET